MSATDIAIIAAVWWLFFRKPDASPSAQPMPSTNLAERMRSEQQLKTLRER